MEQNEKGSGFVPMASAGDGPAYRQVGDRLRLQILSGQLPPGTRLPGEVELASTLGVSRGTVREALRLLASESLIETSRGSTGGTFVTHPHPVDVISYLKDSVGLLSAAGAVDLEELIATRRTLERTAAGLAARMRTPDQAKAIAAMVPPAGADGLDAREAHYSFHETIFTACGNRLLRVLAEPVVNVLRERFTSRYASPRFWAVLRDDHESIAAAIAGGNPEAARRAMDVHLDNLAETYRKGARLTVEAGD